METRLAVGTARRKHTFGNRLDSERTFAQHEAMHRTYVRRRLVLFASALALAAMLGGRVAGALTPSSDGEPRRPSVYVVREGDTLWAIASQVAPGEDPREIVDEIERLNDGLAGPLIVGRSLILPMPG
jgi:hypothetical protein